MRARTDKEAGESLIEIVVSVTILGLGVVALLGGLGTAVFGSALHRDQADVSVVMTSAVEWIKQQVYTECAVKSDYLDTFVYPGYTTTATATGITIDRPASTPVWRVTFSIKDWNGGLVFIDRLPALCAATHADGLRQQEVTITVATANGKVRQSVPIIKRYRDCPPNKPLPLPGCDTLP